MKKTVIVLLFAAVMVTGCQSIDEDDVEIIGKTLCFTAVSILLVLGLILLANELFDWIIEQKTLKMLCEIEELHRRLRNSNSKIAKIDCDFREYQRNALIVANRMNKIISVLTDKGEDA